MKLGLGPPSLARLAVVAACLAGLALGCQGMRPMHPEAPRGHWYSVESSETLADIACRAGVPEEDLLEVNGFRSAAEARPGRLIFVLNGPSPPSDGAQRGCPAGAVAAQPPGASGEQSPTESTPSTNASAARFRWPVDNPRVTSLFGSRWGRPHEGIDLQAVVGTPVYAADRGEVVYSSNTVRGYGNMVVLKHPDGLMTVYAHNSVLIVKVGELVQVGQKIALAGQSGHATGPHVHFEVRRAETPRDPLKFLPGRTNKP